jgi:hypothetical protein
MSSTILRMTFLVAFGAYAVACGNGETPSNASPGPEQDLTAAPAERGVIKLGVPLKGTFASESATKTVTFVAQKGWKLDVSLLTQGCGPQIPNTPACEPAFFGHLILKQGSTVITEGTGSKVSGNVFTGFTAPQDGTYTIVAGVSSRNGDSPLSYRIDVSPPDIECKHSDDCQVHIDGKTIPTGLECARSAFPDEDGTQTFCDVKGGPGIVVH